MMHKGHIPWNKGKVGVQTGCRKGTKPWNMGLVLSKYPGSNAFYRQVFKRYGLTEIHYDEMFKSQNGVCAICHKPEMAKNKQGRLSVDHDHQTNKVRGLLCTRCNMNLGIYEKNLVNFAKYVNEAMARK